MLLLATFYHVTLLLMLPPLYVRIFPSESRGFRSHPVENNGPISNTGKTCASVLKTYSAVQKWQQQSASSSKPDYVTTYRIKEVCSHRRIGGTDTSKSHSTKTEPDHHVISNPPTHKGSVFNIEHQNPHCSLEQQLTMKNVSILSSNLAGFSSTFKILA